MDSFLKDTAKSLLGSGRELKDLVVVLPNRRAGLFFLRYMGELIEEPTWMPEVRTVEQLFSGLAGETPSDDLSLVFEMYEVYRQLQEEAESFDRFYFWGELILKDFNDIDQFMADAASLYRNLSEIKTIESDLSYLTEEQVALISQFWSSFREQKPEEKEKFLRFWQILGDLYQKFNAHLDVLGLTYSGRIYRKVASKIKELNPPAKHHVFVGFNAFTKTEEVLIKHYIKEFGADIFWDIDRYYLEDRRQESGLFFRDYRKDPVFGKTFPEIIPDRIKDKAGVIQTHALPLKVNQANLVGGILEGLGPDEALEETVVILPDEQLLFPVLHTLPGQMTKLNVTMGYPIRNASVYAFLDAILDLQRYLKVREGEVFFYHKQVLDLLALPYLQDANRVFVKEMKAQITSTNALEISAVELAKGGELFGMIFRKTGSTEIFDYLSSLMTALAMQLKEDVIQSSYLFQAYKLLNRMKENFAKSSLEGIQTDFFIKLFRQLFREVKLPFEGEPLEGLQVMGVLESRNLDFKRVIICDVNEGSFPPGGGINSMIPFNLRRAFGLPVQEQNDAIYAYTFYRLLHRAEEVHLLYSTAANQGKAGEMSRFIQQMQVEMGISKPNTVLLEAHLTPGREISMAKTPDILQSLNGYVVQGDPSNHKKKLSASAINSYLDCSLRFYFRYVAGLKESEEVASDVDAGVFGSILHKAIELLYGIPESTTERLITVHNIKRIKEQIPEYVDEAIKDFYGKKKEDKINLTGQMQIVREIFVDYIQAVVDYDYKTGDFKVIGLEKEHHASIPVAVDGEVKPIGLFGLIDRMDIQNGTVRLLDYKTGKDNRSIESISSLFDREHKKRNKAGLQTMLYAYLYQFANPANQKPIKPGLFNVKEIFKKDFNPFMKVDKSDLEDYSDFREEFEEGLSRLLAEIFDPEVPFEQTDDEEKCRYCPYKDICGR
ncbi:PD-(D/E)XK nuclease family protein [Arthrospiribacter ruber]|uniref:PD-(D/E)XK nuclease family protein n=1 Tax=Arthrospiribacter ruber TaxID=2487934 RepID=A0A951IQ47_9BACT|nr:PD-(D/E)XK nuclease family protein [Arthrospiribacter ruber]MBW3466230.1 PD-(D/E)XK nuclease family protein [Arthrospiribacter ruber]